MLQDVLQSFIGEPNQVPKAIPDHLHRVARYGRGQFDAICPLPRWMVVVFDKSGGLKILLAGARGGLVFVARGPAR